MIINLCFAIPVGLGLFFLGIPNALLWGLFAGLLRFIPYLGIWIAASMPAALALAVDPGWSKLLGTMGVFATMEVITYNFIEPWRYAICTGISSMAVLAAAVFWTWLWGPIGLLLSTPLTVCLVVVGRYVPHLEFLSVLLGDEPVLTPEARYYQRLLAMDGDEATNLAEQFINEHSVRRPASAECGMRNAELNGEFGAPCVSTRPSWPRSHSLLAGARTNALRRARRASQAAPAKTVIRPPLLQQCPSWQ